MLINSTTTTQIVKIILADGTRDSINLMPRGRAELPEGATIDPKHYSFISKSVAGTENYKPEGL